MDLNPSARSPLTLSNSFYDDITKDIPSPVSKDFYDAISKPATTAPAGPAIQSRYELASPGEIAETVKAGAEALSPIRYDDSGLHIGRLPMAVAGATASMIRGADPEKIADPDSYLTRIIKTANADAEEYQKKYAGNKVVIAPLSKIGLADIDTQTIARFPQQAGFSGASMIASLAVGAASAPTGPIGTGAAVMAAGGAAGYRMQKDMSAQQLYDKLNENSTKAIGRPLSPEEWRNAYKEKEGVLIEQGISEAIPEAIGNLVGFELFLGAAKNVFGKQIARSAIGDVLGKTGRNVLEGAAKLLAEQATEQGTETVSQLWQHNLDIDLGVAPAGDTKRSWTDFGDIWKSFQEVFPDIFLLTMMSGGAGLVGGRIQTKMKTAKDAQLVKDVVSENKFDAIPNEFLPEIYAHSEELVKERPKDKDLIAARDAFTKEMDRRGIDYDMSSKLQEYLNLTDKMKEGVDITGDDVARWGDLRDDFKEKNIDPDIYKVYLDYQTDVTKATDLVKLNSTGKATEPQRKELLRLIDAIATRGKIMGLPEEALAASGVEKGGVVRKPLEPVKGAARDVLLEGDPDAKKKIMTAKDILTEGDVNIQSEEDLTPEALAGIDKKL